MRTLAHVLLPINWRVMISNSPKVDIGRKYLPSIFGSVRQPPLLALWRRLLTSSRLLRYCRLRPHLGDLTVSDNSRQHCSKPHLRCSNSRSRLSIMPTHYLVASPTRCMPNFFASEITWMTSSYLMSLSPDTSTDNSGFSL